MSGVAPAADVLAAGGPRLADLLERTEARLLEATSDHGDALAELAMRTLTAGGKRLRPTLLFLAAGDASSDKLVDAAVAVELLHMATLVHDDVLDRAALRRGQPTIFASAGRAAATATGDLLFSRAFAVVAPTGHRHAVRALSDAASGLARGELMQREDAWAGTVTRERYLERCRLKTARLFEAACMIGSLLGDPAEDGAGNLSVFGLEIGIGFQILDDVLDVSGPPERTGKPRGTDLLDGTVTLPLILARERDPAIAGLDLRAVVTDAPAAAELCDRIAATGALEDARAAALEHVAEGKRWLNGVELSGEQRALLDLAADRAVERYA